MNRGYVNVRFQQGAKGEYSSQPYTYWYDRDMLTLSEGDYVVVDVQSDRYTSGLKVAKVDKVVGDSRLATKWIVDKVRYEFYQANVQRTKELAALEAELYQRAERARQLLDLETLKRIDPEIGNLLARRNALQG